MRPGEKVPVDGEVISAESFMTPDAAYVDESMITGERHQLRKERLEGAGRNNPQSRQVSYEGAPDR